ncbi:MAG: hypothetical protein HFF42_06385 [Lawsonibacter sp.]|jgi:hypothetical protein|nr:hypothetical protein [Lawsonibacter sp.]
MKNFKKVLSAVLALSLLTGVASATSRENLAETVSADKEISTFSLSQIDPELTLPEAIEQYPQILDIFYVRILSDEEIEQCKADGVGTIEDEDISAVALLSSLNARKVPVDAAPGSVYGSSQNGPWPYEQVN